MTLPNIPAKPSSKVPMPSAFDDQLHPLAQDLLKALRAGKVGSNERVRIGGYFPPEFEVTNTLAQCTVAAFHTILKNLEDQKILYRKRQGSFDGGHFRRGHDRIYLKVQEVMVDEERSGRGQSSREYWGNASGRKVPSGRLEFALSPKSWFFSDAVRFTEEKKRSLEKVVSKVVAEIRRHFAKAKRERAQRTIEYKHQQEVWRKNREEYERTEAARQREQKERAHVQALVTANQDRETALLKGAALWRACKEAEEFVGACETRWRLAQSGNLTDEQAAWLQWARSIAARFNPFECGYPDPIVDGAFSPETTPFGGPYPMAFSFPVLAAAARMPLVGRDQSASRVVPGQIVNEPSDQR